MPAFEYRQAQELRDRFRQHGIRYLFIGKSGAILLGFPDTTQETPHHSIGSRTPASRALDAGFCNSQSVGVTRVIDGWVLPMPIYEFACPKCRRIFNFLSKRLNPDDLPVCPKCGSRKMI